MCVVCVPGHTSTCVYVHACTWRPEVHIKYLDHSLLCLLRWGFLSNPELRGSSRLASQLVPGVRGPPSPLSGRLRGCGYIQRSCYTHPAFFCESWGSAPHSSRLGGKRLYPPSHRPNLRLSKSEGSGVDSWPHSHANPQPHSPGGLSLLPFVLFPTSFIHSANIIHLGSPDVSFWVLGPGSCVRRRVLKQSLPSLSSVGAPLKCPRP